MTDNDRIEPSCAAVALGCMCAKCANYWWHCCWDKHQDKCPVTHCIEFKQIGVLQPDGNKN